MDHQANRRLRLSQSGDKIDALSSSANLTLVLSFAGGDLLGIGISGLGRAKFNVKSSGPNPAVDESQISPSYSRPSNRAAFPPKISSFCRFEMSFLSLIRAIVWGNSESW